MTLFFANSNIDTREEFEKRLESVRVLAQAEGAGLEVLEYDHDEWLREVAEGFEGEPEKGARCERCFRYNLAKTAAFATARGYEGFSTSLTVSPHKSSALIFSACDSPLFEKIDFKKKDGFKLSVRRAAELGLYRQSYCGCEFSRGR